MPDRKTIEAATPKCPEKPALLGAASGRPLCGMALRWNHERVSWACTIHGEVLAAQLLTHQQRSARYA